MINLVFFEENKYNIWDMKRPQLKVEKRTILGKKIKQLRKQGILPGNIYGKGLKSQSVQVSYKEFDPIFKEVGKTGLIDVVLDSSTHPVLIHNVHVNPITDQTLHADFFEVNLKEKITTMVPLVVVGEAVAVTEKIGLQLQSLSEVEVEALPEDLPENIEVPVEHLAAIDEQITVGNLKAPKGVTILTDANQTVVKIEELVSEEAKEDAAAAEAASEEAKTEGADGETTEGEAKEESSEKAETDKETPEEKKE